MHNFSTMKKKCFPIVLAMLGGLMLLGSALAADDSGKLFANACTSCHTAKRQPLNDIRLTRGEWSEVITRMISYGAEVPKQKLSELLDYLAVTRAPTSDSAEKKK